MSPDPQQFQITFTFNVAAETCNDAAEKMFSALEAATQVLEGYDVLSYERKTS